MGCLVLALIFKILAKGLISDAIGRNREFVTYYVIFHRTLKNRDFHCTDSFHRIVGYAGDKDSIRGFDNHILA